MQDNSETNTPQSALRLGQGDLIELKVFGAPELGSTLRVSSQGEITVPLIDSMKVLGLTPEQTQSHSSADSAMDFCAILRSASW